MLEGRGGKRREEKREEIEEEEVAEGKEKAEDNQIYRVEDNVGLHIYFCCDIDSHCRKSEGVCGEETRENEKEMEENEKDDFDEKFRQKVNICW